MPTALTPEEAARYVDCQGALARVRGNVTLYRRMLNLFLSSPEFGALDEALCAGDAARAGEVAHGIKGMTGNLALTRLYEISARLMDTLRGGLVDGALVEEYREILAQTRVCVEELLSQPAE